MFVHLFLQLWHIFVNQSDITLSLCYFYYVLWRFDVFHMVLSLHSAPNPIQSIRFSQIMPHFHSISTPYPFPYGVPLHWRALLLMFWRPFRKKSKQHFWETRNMQPDYRGRVNGNMHSVVDQCLYLPTSMLLLTLAMMDFDRLTHTPCYRLTQVNTPWAPLWFSENNSRMWVLENSLWNFQYLSRQQLCTSWQNTRSEATLDQP